MPTLKIGHTYLVNPISVKIGDLVLKQDEYLFILSHNNASTSFRRETDGTVHTVDTHALAFCLEEINKK